MCTRGFYSATVSHCFRPDSVSFKLCSHYNFDAFSLFPFPCFLCILCFSLCPDHYFLPLISFLCFFLQDLTFPFSASLFVVISNVSFTMFPSTCFVFSTVCLCILCVLLFLKHFHPYHCFFRILCFHDKCFILTCFNLTVSFSLVCFPIYHNRCFVTFSSFSQFNFCFMLHW